METVFERKLRTERDKLNSLVDQALENGTPIAETYEIIKQCEKVNRIISERDNKSNENRTTDIFPSQTP